MVSVLLKRGVRIGGVSHEPGAKVEVDRLLAVQLVHDHKGDIVPEVPAEAAEAVAAVESVDAEDGDKPSKGKKR